MRCCLCFGCLPFSLCRFTISGWIGTALFYLLYEFIIARGALSRPLCGVGWIDKLEWASVAWTSAYLASIVWQHALHRALVFGSESAYWPSLAWTYVSYSLSIVLSSVFQHAMVAWMGVNHRVAFGASLVATGVINYFTLKNAFEAPKQKKVGVE